MMTEQQLREALVQSLRKLDPESELLKSFWSAVVYRRENAAVDERQPGQPGLMRALERALALVNVVAESTEELQITPGSPPSSRFPIDLAAAAEALPDWMFRLAISRAKRYSYKLENDVDVDALLQKALSQYASLADSSLSPGP